MFVVCVLCSFVIASTVCLGFVWRSQPVGRIPTELLLRAYPPPRRIIFGSQNRTRRHTIRGLSNLHANLINNRYIMRQKQ